jgi:hypothetical protein
VCYYIQYHIHVFDKKKKEKKKKDTSSTCVTHKIAKFFLPKANIAVIFIVHII